MCYNCGEDGHKMKDLSLPSNPPEFQNALKKMGVKAKRHAGVIPGFERRGVEHQKMIQRQQWQNEGRSISVSWNLKSCRQLNDENISSFLNRFKFMNFFKVHLIEKELEDVMVILEDFKQRTISLRTLRLYKSEPNDEKSVVVSRKEEVEAAHAELRSFLPRIKEIMNVAKGVRYVCNNSNLGGLFGSSAVITYVYTWFFLETRKAELLGSWLHQCLYEVHWRSSKGISWFSDARVSFYQLSYCHCYIFLDRSSFCFNLITKMY